MKIKKQQKKPVGVDRNDYQLPIDRREPSNNPWQYAYQLTGHKKIGKTSWAIEGADEFIIQFDKPQIAYAVREVCPKNWDEFKKVLSALEKAAASGDFPYNRVIVDGAGELYALCQAHVCKHFGVEHPKDVGFAAGWHKLRDDFSAAINRLMRLQVTAECGLVFIAHAEWREAKDHDGIKIEKLASNMPKKAEDIIGGKVDGWFVYDYRGSERVLTLVGNEGIDAGHRIDGHFVTTDGRKVEEIWMGKSPKDAMEAFIKAFNNEQEYATYKEWREAQKSGDAKKTKKLSLKRAR